MTVRIATRGSRLARLQAETVARALGDDAELVVVSTEGDRRQDVELHAIGGRGVFAKEVQQAVLDGRADVAVHSAKDLPPDSPAGLVIAAIPERRDPRDALVGARLDAIPTGGTVATGSVRRRAQLAAVRPDLAFANLRGNIETRLAKADGFDAIVVALAALERLELTDHVAEVVPATVLLPQVGQGALAVECRADDDDTRARLDAIDDSSAHRAVDAERSFLRHLGGGCDLPCGALAAMDAGGTIGIDVAVASLDGQVLLRVHCDGTDPVALGDAAAHDLLDGAGARELLGVAG